MCGRKMGVGRGGREIDFWVCCLSLRVATTGSGARSWRQDLRTLKWMAEAQTFEASLAAFQGSLAKSWSRTGAIGTWTDTPIWDDSITDGSHPLWHSTNPYFLCFSHTICLLLQASKLARGSFTFPVKGDSEPYFNLIFSLLFEVY